MEIIANTTKELEARLSAMPKAQREAIVALLAETVFESSKNPSNSTSVKAVARHA
jgi:hypothetical protein